MWSYESFDAPTRRSTRESAQAAYGPTLEVALRARAVPGRSHVRQRDAPVDNALDDAEESQAELQGEDGVGFLYQGSSDLEIGNDLEVGGAVRRHPLPTADPEGRAHQERGAMLTIDESYNKPRSATSTRTTWSCAAASTSG